MKEFNINLLNFLFFKIFIIKFEKFEYRINLYPILSSHFIKVIILLNVAFIFEKYGNIFIFTKNNVLFISPNYMIV